MSGEEALKANGMLIISPPDTTEYDNSSGIGFVLPETFYADCCSGVSTITSIQDSARPDEMYLDASRHDVRHLEGGDLVFQNEDEDHKSVFVRAALSEGNHVCLRSGEMDLDADCLLEVIRKLDVVRSELETFQKSLYDYLIKRCSRPAPDNGGEEGR